MWPGAVSGGRVWRLAQALDLGQPPTGVRAELRRAAALIWSRGSVDWRLPSWSDVCASRGQPKLLGSRFCQRPEMFFSVRGAASHKHPCSAGSERPPETAWIIQNPKICTLVCHCST